MRFLNWLRSWFFVQSNLAWNMQATRELHRKIKALERERCRVDVALRESEKRFDDLYGRLAVELSTAKSLIASGAKVNSSYSEALDAAMEKLKSAEEIIIPSLVAGHKLVIKRTEADVAIQAARIVNATPIRESE